MFYLLSKVLSVYNVSTWQEAIAIENANPFGNAAAVYTSNGGHAEWFMKRVRASVSSVTMLIFYVGVVCCLLHS